MSRRAFRWPRSAREARTHATLAAIVLWIAALVVYAAGPGDRSIAGPLKGADFVQFYTIGYLARTHDTASLYDFTALHAAQARLVPESAAELYPPVYPPQAALLFAPFSLLSFAHATLLWNAITIALFALIVRSAWRTVADRLPDSRFAFAAAAAFPPFWSLILHGQATILILLAFWAGWLALERDRRFLAGFALGLLLIKPQWAIPLLVLVLIRREWAMVMGALASIAAQVGAILVAFGWSVVKAYAAFVPVMLTNADLLEPKPYQSHSLRALTRLAPEPIGLLFWIALSAIVIAFMLRVWKSSAPLRVRFGMVMLAAVLVNPHLIVYDATVLALPLVWFGGYVAQDSSKVAQDFSPAYWTTVYWLFVALLAPSARAIGLQVSVLLMLWLMVVVARIAAGRLTAPALSASPLPLSV